MIRFINEHRDRFGVELICRVLRPAVRGSSPHAATAPRSVGRRPRGGCGTTCWCPEVARLHAENYGVYGRRKMHALMRRQGWDIGRDQTERLMRLAGVRGVRKSKRVFTTKSDRALRGRPISSTADSPPPGRAGSGSAT